MNDQNEFDSRTNPSGNSSILPAVFNLDTLRFRYAYLGEWVRFYFAFIFRILAFGIGALKYGEFPHLISKFVN